MQIFQRQKLVLNIFLKYVFLNGKNFALGLKASRVLAMSIFSFSFYFLGSQIFEMISFVFWLALLN